jgi:GT2 family glycosyltransferase
LDLSICIVNWNTKKHLANCLDAIERAGTTVAHEIIVVDNASSDGSPEMVRQEHPQVRLIVSASNLGLTAGNNRAIAEAAGRYLLLLNSDTIVQPGAFDSLVTFLDEHPDAAAAGPKVLNADGSIQFSARHFPNLLVGLFRNTPLGRLFPRNRFTREYLMTDWDHSEPREVDWISGAAMCLRRKAVDDVGALDERFYMYCEDMEWCYRARLAGWRIYYAPTAVITHLGGRSSDLCVLPMVREFHGSMRAFYWKHYAQRWPLLLRWLPPLGVRLRELLVLGQNRVALRRNGIQHRDQEAPSSSTTKGCGR